MKQIAKLTTILMLLLVGAGFTACSDDDDNNSSSSTSIVGKWRCDWSEDGWHGYEIITFNANGTGSYKREEYGSHGEHFEDSGTFTYTYRDGILILDYGDGEPERYSINISGGKFTMDGDTYVRVS